MEIKLVDLIKILPDDEVDLSVNNQTIDYQSLSTAEKIQYGRMVAYGMDIDVNESSQSPGPLVTIYIK